MFTRPRTDFWRVGIVPRPLTELALLGEAGLSAARAHTVWLPEPSDWCYRADPFALQRGERLHVFVEAFDYRAKHAVIERHELRLPDLQWLGAQVVLARPFHLSYPFVFEHQGQAWMLPESHRAGELALYRGSADLNHWQRECALLPGLPVAEASVIEHQGRWWMFYTLVGPQARDQRELHLAHAPALTGPWTPHPLNPVLQRLDGARPGGTPFHDAQGRVVLPVQDCSETYGGAARLLCFDQLEPDALRCAHLAARFSGGLLSDTHRLGLHTLSACGAYTLVDVKRQDRRLAKRWLDWQRRWRRLFGRPAFNRPA